jgi:hypothetical protein
MTEPHCAHTPSAATTTSALICSRDSNEDTTMKPYPTPKSHSRARTPFTIGSSARRWATLLALGLWASACSRDSTSEPVTSSQTHWLMHCDSSTDCGNGLTCECGVCTKSCDANPGCEGLGENAVCAATDDVTACGVKAPSNICVQGCGKNSECGSNATCDDGACVPLPDNTADAATSATPPTPDAPPGVRCDDYATCDIDTMCTSGACYALPECSSGICIDSAEVCALSCPEDSECLTLDSYPGQVACEGRVPAIPGATDEPTGLDCSDYVACDIDTPCNDGDCFAFEECGGGICVDQDVACAALGKLRLVQERSAANRVRRPGGAKTRNPHLTRRAANGRAANG